MITNAAIATQSPLLPTGAGRRVRATDRTLSGEHFDELVDLVGRFGFVVVEGLSLTEKECEELCYLLGKPVTYDDASVGYGYDVLVDLNGSPDPTKVITGIGSMPLHSDGILFQNRVDIVLLYCMSTEGSQKGESATLVCDQRTAVRSLPQDVMDTIRRNGFEYYIVERGYFSIQSEAWIPVRGTLSFGGEEVLYVALPFEQGVPIGWLTRVASLTEEESATVMRTIDTHLRDSQFLYTHDWKVGDLLLVDNRLTLHGRTRITGNRRLLNGQVNIEGWR